MNFTDLINKIARLIPVVKSKTSVALTQAFTSTLLTTGISQALKVAYQISKVRSISERI